MKSQAMIDQIKELQAHGHSIRKISESLGISRNTVRHYLRGTDIQSAISRPEKGDWIKTFDWDTVVKEVNSGVTKMQLFKEYQPLVSYKRFCKLLFQRCSKPVKPACRISHTPGEKTFVDYCDGIKITCPKTGQEIKSQFFCGVLPFSSYAFGCFTEDQKLSNFIRCHEKMWAYFGGVTPYVVVDNLKSGVKKAHLYDPDKNPTYCDYGNHVGFAVLPARPYTPRDKAVVETTIGVIQKTFFLEVRNERFYSLSELNVRFMLFLANFNRGIMKDYGVSRLDRYLNEKDKLLKFSSTPYELSEWKTAKVHPDCCIQVDKCFYSVPFQYCGQNVRVKLTDKILEVYSENLDKITTHLRSIKPNVTKIDENHLPPWSIQSSRFEILKCRQKAKAIGPNTYTLIDEWFSGPRPLEFLRRAQGLCRIGSQGFSNEAIEYACSQAKTFKKYRLSYIKSCAEAFSSRPKLKSQPPIRDPKTLHLHGGN